MELTTYDGEYICGECLELILKRDEELVETEEVDDVELREDRGFLEIDCFSCSANIWTYGAADEFSWERRAR